MIYSEDLSNIYQEVFYLITAIGFGNPEYINKITPVERKIYWSFYARDQKNKEEKSKQNKSPMQLGL